MSQQSARQRARRAAREVSERRRRELREKERRMTDLVEVVVVALAERDGSVATTEARAGRALRQWTEGEGQTLAEFVAWCCGAVTTREAARLRRQAADAEQPSVE